MPENYPSPDAAVADVWRLLDERVAPLEYSRAPLEEARGRLLGEDVRADADQPPFDRSAVDGYALAPGASHSRYRVVGVVKAGQVAARPPGPGEALRIFTGADVPGTGLAIVMQEDVRAEGDFIHVGQPPAPGENVRYRGSDAKAGDVLLKAGVRLNPVAMALLASVGLTRPLINGAPRIAHATTGDEIVPPDQTPGPGQIRNSNQALIAALLKNYGWTSNPVHQEHWGDDPVRAAARFAAEPFASADLILVSGGASVGDHDYAARVLEGAGFELPIRKVNARPGRPLLVGFRGSQLVFGLPGNPVSHFVCFHLFVQRALTRMLRLDARKWLGFPLTEALPAASNRRPTYWPGVLEQGSRHGVRPLPWNNSGHLAALVEASVLFLVPPGTPALPAGAKVDTLIIGPPMRP